MKKTLFIRKLVLVFILATLSSSQVFAAKSIMSRPGVNQFISRMSSKYRYSPGYIRWVLSKARYSPEVIRRMERPYEASPWYDYRKLFVTTERTTRGVHYWNRSNKLLAWEEREYAVPSDIIVAIIGIESKYGKDMGHFRVLSSLATLAFYYPPRAKFFRNELASYILMTKVYRMRPDAVFGSYAGAMGQCQFMPSSYLHYAVDFHGRGNPNLFRDKADIIFSVGNYLRQNGWEPAQPIATQAKLEGSRYREILKANSRKPKQPRLSLNQLAKYGVYPVGKFNPRLEANLIKLQGANGPEYWLTFHNFYVITTYNTSDLYAMAVFQLAKKINLAYHNQDHIKRKQEKELTTQTE